MIDIAIVLIGGVAGAIGGALYQVVPMDDNGAKEPKDMAWKRVIAGAVVGVLACPALGLISLGANYTTMASVSAIMFAGYGAIDTLKQLFKAIKK